MVTRVSAAVAASIASGGPEKIAFLNDIVKHLWPNINEIAGNLTKEIVEPMFEQMLPGPLSKLKFTKIDLGENPIMFDRIDVHSRDSNDVMKVDVDVFWDGQCDIQLKSIVGSFGVQSIKLAGRISLLLTPLLNRLPLVAAIQLGFINPPQLRLDFTGLAEIAEFCLIEKTIYKIVDQVLAGMLVLPNRMLVKLDPQAYWYDAFQPDLGILRFTVEKGYGFITPKAFIKDIPDVYARVRLGANEEYETEVVKNSCEPEWNDTRDIVLSDHDQMITIKCLDSDFTTADDSLGDGRISVGSLLLESGNQIAVPLVVENIDTGAKVDVHCEVFELTSDLSSFEQEEFSAENSLCGILYVLVSGVKHLPVECEEANSSIKVEAFDKKFHTMVCKYQPDVLGIDYLNPCYDAGFRVPLTQSMVGDPTEVKFTLMNGKEKLGHVNIPFEDIQGEDGAMMIKEFSLGNGAIILAKVMLKGLQPCST